jgi:hypothetical protein
VTEKGDVMKRRLWLVSLAGMLIFGLTLLKPPVYAGEAQTPVYVGEAPRTVPPKCKDKSSKCLMKITLNLKDGAVIVEKEDDDGRNPVQTTPGGPGPGNPVKLIDYALIFFTQSSPGCAYYYFSGTWWLVCD